MMKNLYFLYIVLLVLSVKGVYTQSLYDYISAVKGDTLIIKDYSEMGNQASSLYYTLLLDSVNVPPGRVYELKANGYYPLAHVVNTRPGQSITLVGSDSTPVVNNKNPLSAPPIICSYDVESESISYNDIEAYGNITIKNCALLAAESDGSIGWLFMASRAPNLSFVFDNCIMERNRWVFVLLDEPDSDITFRNCYFVNMVGQPCKRNGGVYDSFVNQGTLIVENCTHVMGQGYLYNFRDNSYSRILFNHNTFINCGGQIFNNLGLLNKMVMTSNIFVNCNIQLKSPYMCDCLGPDYDYLPVGLVNVYRDDYGAADGTSRKYLVQNNLVYWDSYFADCDSIVNANAAYGMSGWESQMIIMNSRSQRMFDDDVNCPYLVTDTWLEQMPHFINPQDLFTDQLSNVKNFVIGTSDTGSAVMDDWRLVNNGPDDFVRPDWPIPVDLSYTDEKLVTSGMNEYPIGDLNWFPAQKERWQAQRTLEYDLIDNALETGSLVTSVSIENDHHTPNTFQLLQNYPNPFNPNTTISFTLSKAGHVTLDVFNIQGQKVVTLVNDYLQPQTRNLTFDATGLASGIYYYTLELDNQRVTKKMVKLK